MLCKHMQGAPLLSTEKRLCSDNHSFVRNAFELSRIIGCEDYMFQMNLGLFYLNLSAVGI